MKKIFIYFALIICLSMNACSIVGEDDQTESTTPDSQTEGTNDVTTPEQTEENTTSTTSVSQTEIQSDTTTTDLQMKKLDISKMTKEQKEILEEAVYKFSAFFDPSFESGDRVCVDDLMLFFTLFHMRADDGKLLEELKQYEIDKNNYEIKIPKDIVNDFLSSVFMVEIDDSNSYYYKGNDKEHYYLRAEVRGLSYRKCIDFFGDGDIIIVEYERGRIDPDEPKDNGVIVDGRYMLGIKITDEQNVKYMFCRKIS